MKITLNHGKFAKYLQYASRAVSQKPNIPILSNVKLEATKNDLKISATNLEMGINMWIPGIVDSDGSLTVSAKYIADFVSAINEDRVELSQEESILIVKTPKSKANFSIIPATEFPVLPKIPETKLFTISSKELLTSLDKVLFSCSTDLSSGKIQQSGVLFEISDETKEEVSFIGLDGFRLSKRVSKVFGLNRENHSQIIVPSKYLNELIKIISDLEEVDEISVYLSENKSQIIFKFEDIEFSVRLLEGPYPDYKRIMPDTYSYSFEVGKSELEEALKVISTFAKSNLAYKTLFDMDLENSVIKFKSVVNEVGENETVIEVEDIQGESDLNTAYNLRYLQDIVNHISGQKIRFESKGPLAASVIKDLSDENFLHLLMPLRREV
jgi:DNA polymerase-3 subunit beta